jgi:hypothetical protein
MLFKNTALAAKLRVWRKTDKKKKSLTQVNLSMDLMFIQLFHSFKFS